MLWTRIPGWALFPRFLYKHPCCTSCPQEHMVGKMQELKDKADDVRNRLGTANRDLMNYLDEDIDKLQDKIKDEEHVPPTLTETC